MTMPRKLIWLAIGLLGCAAVLSATWFYMASRIEKSLSQTLEREAAAGRQWTCKERTLNGFPIAFRLRCTGLELKAVRNANTQSGKLAAITAKFNILSPGFVRIEAIGPGNLIQSQGSDPSLQASKSADANWNSLRLDIGLSMLKPHTMRLASQNAKISIARINALPADLTISDVRIDLELQPGKSPFLDLHYNAAIQQLVSPELDSFVADDTPAGVFWSGTLSNLNLLQKNGTSPPQMIEAWSRGGGKLIIEDFAILKTNFQFATSGEVILDNNGFPEGRLTVGASGISGLMRRFGVSPGAVAIEGMLGRWTKKRTGNASPVLADRPPALPVPIVLRNGRLFIGPVQTSMRLPQLY